MPNLKNFVVNMKNTEDSASDPALRPGLGHLLTVYLNPHVTKVPQCYRMGDKQFPPYDSTMRGQNLTLHGINGPGSLDFALFSSRSVIVAGDDKPLEKMDMLIAITGFSMGGHRPEYVPHAELIRIIKPADEEEEKM